MFRGDNNLINGSYDDGGEAKNDIAFTGKSLFDSFRKPGWQQQHLPEGAVAIMCEITNFRSQRGKCDVTLLYSLIMLADR